MQERTDHAVVLIGCLGNAGHADQVPLHEQAADLTPGFPGPAPVPKRLLATSSRMILIDDAGHFLHLEEPGQVNDHILSWVS